MDPVTDRSDEAKTVTVMMHVLGVDEFTAREILAIDRGEVPGDVIAVEPHTLDPIKEY